MREEEVTYESTLAEVYNAHREQVDALNLELTANEEDLQQGSAAMNQWRTQWEEELTEKNSIDAELLTLRTRCGRSNPHRGVRRCHVPLPRATATCHGHVS